VLLACQSREGQVILQIAWSIVYNQSKIREKSRRLDEFCSPYREIAFSGNQPTDSRVKLKALSFIIVTTLELFTQDLQLPWTLRQVPNHG